MRRDPGLVDAHFGLGEALARRGRWLDASQAFREAARLRPSDVEYQGNLVLALARAGLWAHAVEALRRLARLRPCAEAHILIGAIERMKLRRPEESIRAFRWAVRLELAPPSARFWLPEALLGAGAWEHALRCFREARGLAPADSTRQPRGVWRTALHHHPGAPLVSLRPSTARVRLGWFERLGHVGARWRLSLSKPGSRVLGVFAMLRGAAREVEARDSLLHCYSRAGTLSIDGRVASHAAAPPARHVAGLPRRRPPVPPRSDSERRSA